MDLLEYFIRVYILLNLIKSTYESESEFPGHGKPFGSMGPFVNMDETNDINSKAFFENYVNKRKPLLLKGAVKEFPPIKLWTDEYLSNAATDHDDYKLVVETVKKESRNQDIIGLSLKEFIQKYKDKEIYMVNPVPPFIRKDVPLPFPLQCEKASDALEETV